MVRNVRNQWIKSTFLRSIRNCFGRKWILLKFGHNSISIQSFFSRFTCNDLKQVKNICKILKKGKKSTDATTEEKLRYIYILKISNVQWIWKSPLHIYQLVQQLNIFFYFGNWRRNIWDVVNIMKKQWLVVLYIYNLVKDHKRLNKRNIADIRQIWARMIF